MTSEKVFFIALKMGYLSFTHLKSFIHFHIVPHLYDFLFPVKFK